MIVLLPSRTNPFRLLLDISFSVSDVHHLRCGQISETLLTYGLPDPSIIFVDHFNWVPRFFFHLLGKDSFGKSIFVFCSVKTASRHSNEVREVHCCATSTSHSDYVMSQRALENSVSSFRDGLVMCRCCISVIETEIIQQL